MKPTLPDDLPVPAAISVPVNAPVPPASPFLVGFRAAKANLVPGLCVQAFMLVIVFAYYRLGQFRPWFDRLGEYKQDGGFVFTAVS